MHVLSAGWSDSLQSYQSHYHDAHELLYVQTGTVRVQVGTRQILASAGSLLVFSRFEAHCVQILSGTYRRYTLLISPSISGRGESYLLSSVLVNRSAGFDHMIPCGGLCGEVEDILEQMYRESRDRKPLHETVLDALLIRLLCMVYRIAPQLFVQEDNRNTRMVRQLQNRFEQNYSEEYTLRELAMEYHVSTSHLAHSFKKITGYSPMDYLISCRISAAKSLLAASEKSIGQIVAMCGFSDESNFSRTFRNKTGMTPSAFRGQNTHGVAQQVSG